MKAGSTEDEVDVMAAWHEFWASYAQAFAQPVQANGLLSKFVTNPDVTGAYAEAWVRSMIKNMLGHRYRISTGTVIRPTDKARGLRALPQCDVIVWDPSELPAIFEAGDFALVPIASVRAILEIKRNVDSAAKMRKLQKQLNECVRLLPHPTTPLLGVVMTHRRTLFDQLCEADWLRKRDRLEPAITRLLDLKNIPDKDGVLAFIYFLAQIGGHSSRIAGRR